MSAKKRKMVLDLFSQPLERGANLTFDSNFDEDETEPGTDDEGYHDYWRRRNGKANIRTVKRPDGQGKTENPVVMLISLKVVTQLSLSRHR